MAMSPVVIRSDIPNLTYEEYLDFHRQYYHPVNSYIYLYGDMDVTERLEWMDANYLSNFPAITIDSKIPLQKPFAEHKVFRKEICSGSGRRLQ